MDSIKEIFKPTTSKTTSSKNPKWYNNEKNQLIREASVSSEPAVRRFIAMNTHTPSKVLADMLKVERDKSILRVVIMAPNTSRKAVATFINDASDKRVEWFENDVEMIEHFTEE